MAADLFCGTVPSLYRRIYDVVMPLPEWQVTRQVFIKLWVKSDLLPGTVSEIWDTLDCKQGNLTRTCLYKALALTALAQQGKTPNDKFLENYTDQELPVPKMGELADLRALCMRLRWEQNPTQLSVTYKELTEMDLITIEIVPEKKGIFLKHVEYDVASRRFKSKARRRYNDFLALHDLLMIKYPYRMVPRLPPKKIVGADAHFIEQRRRALVRYLTLIVRHPMLSEDKIVRYFFVFQGAEMQYKIREQFRNIPDEFLISELAAKKDLVPLDSHVHLATSREQIKFIHFRLIQFEEILQRMVTRSQTYASDMLDIHKEFSALSCEPHITSMWATGSCDTWNYLKNGFRDLGQAFRNLSDRAVHQTTLQEEEILDQLNLFLDLLTSYRDLCERQEKGAIQDHQKVLTKVVTIRRKVNQASYRGADVNATEDLESRIAEQETCLQTMDRRNQFAVHCIHLETQLVHVSMRILYDILQNMATVFASCHSELTRVWKNIIPIVEKIMPDTLDNKEFLPNGSPEISTRPTSPNSESSITYPSR